MERERNLPFFIVRLPCGSMACLLIHARSLSCRRFSRLTSLSLSLSLSSLFFVAAINDSGSGCAATLGSSIARRLVCVARVGPGLKRLRNILPGEDKESVVVEGALVASEHTKNIISHKY